MADSKPPANDPSAALASELLLALQRERIVPRFVDSYVVDHGRYALQTHAGRYRELLALLQREALLALTVHALEQAAVLSNEKRASGRRRLRVGTPTFRRNFFHALARLQKWSAGDALEFQSEVRVYEELLARRPGAQRARKAYGTADHPFVDRCAILLDPSFIEQARAAAARALAELEGLASSVAVAIFPPPAR